MESADVSTPSAATRAPDTVTKTIIKVETRTFQVVDEHNASAPAVNEEEQDNSFRNTWDDFKTALYSVEADFDAWYWTTALLSALVRALYLKSRLDKVWRPILPLVAYIAILIVLWLYFYKLHYRIVLPQWCPTKHNDDSHDIHYCLWGYIHPSLALYFGIMILWNFSCTVFTSPGVAAPPTPSSPHDPIAQQYYSCSLEDCLQCQNQHYQSHIFLSKPTHLFSPWKSVDSRGGCLFLNPFQANLKLEQYRSNCYNLSAEKLLDRERRKVDGNGNQNVFYHPSPFPTFCHKCRITRPPRCHHCRICNRCILEMDHHCPYVNNCIGLANYRTFFLTIFFLSLGCWYGALLLLLPFIRTFRTTNWYYNDYTFGINKLFYAIIQKPTSPWQFVTQADEQSVVKILFPFLFALAVLFSFFLCDHISLVGNGITTLEQRISPSNEAPTAYKIWNNKGRNNGSAHHLSSSKTNVFDRGWKSNFYRVLGGCNLFWMFLPVHVPITTSGFHVHLQEKEE